MRRHSIGPARNANSASSLVFCINLLDWMRARRGGFAKLELDCETISGHMNKRRNFMKSAVGIGAGATMGAMAAAAAPAPGDRTSAPGGIRVGNLYFSSGPASDPKRGRILSRLAAISRNRPTPS